MAAHGFEPRPAPSPPTPILPIRANPIPAGVVPVPANPPDAAPAPSDDPVATNKTAPVAMIRSKVCGFKNINH
jgi:hypothetical protein